MKKAKLFTVFMIILLALSQFSMVSAATCDPTDSICGTVQEITIQTVNGASTVWVVIQDDQGVDHTVQISMATALEWHLVVYEDGVLVPNDDAIGTDIELPLSEVLPGEGDELKHPVGSALAIYFSEDISGLTYDKIMGAHQDGYGFGVIAQALWLTKKLNGDSTLLIDILDAKSSGDYQAFFEEGSTIPTSWGQFRKAIMDKGTLGTVMSNKDQEKDKEPGNAGMNDNGSNQVDKKDVGTNQEQDKTNAGNTTNPGNNDPKGNNGNNENHGNKDNNGNKNKPQ